MNIKQTEERLREYLSFAENYPHLFVNDEEKNSLDVILDYDTLLKQQNVLYDNADNKNIPRNFCDIGILSEDNWVITLRDLVKFPNGEYSGYIRMLNKNSALYLSCKDVVILPILNHAKILLIRHFRHDDRKWHLEIPRGFGEQGYSAIENAKRELMEETGISSEKIEVIGGENGSVVYVVAHISNIGSESSLESNEGISEKYAVTYNEFKTMIINGKINDFYTIAASAYAMIQGVI